MIPLCDPKQQYFDLKDEIDRAINEVASGGCYILGPNVKAFEQEVAEFCGCKFAIGVNSGTDALHLSLRALGIGPGDEVITTPFTFIATTEAICLTGATPVFVDVDPQTYNVDPAQIPERVTSKTRAILPVHLYGQPCDMDAITAIADRYGLAIVEDCAQAMGATYRGKRVGSIGAAGCFSFFPSKNLGCLGDGGMIVTNDEQLYRRAEMLRRHGGKIKYHHTELGLNSRLDELQAAILRVKLTRLDNWNAKRREIAQRYGQQLRNNRGVKLPKYVVDNSGSSNTSPHTNAVYHQFTVQVEHRDQVADHLSRHGVSSFPYYPVPLHLQEVHANLGLQRGDYPVAEALADRCLSLPIDPSLSAQQQQHVIHEIKQATKPSKRVRTTDDSPQLVASAYREFSFANYRTLIGRFKDSGYEFAEFAHASTPQSANRPYVLLRHDIDMELERALQMAHIEAELGAQATYFFLLRTDHYNLLSRQGSNCVKQILNLGHHLGLHFDCAAYCDHDVHSGVDEWPERIRREATTLGDWFDCPVKVVSFHRPAPFVLTGNSALSAPLRHTYEKQYTEQTFYCSDSRGKFAHEYPTDSKAFAEKKPMHLLIHPIWWSDQPTSAVDQLNAFVKRRESSLLSSISENCTIFKPQPGRQAA